MNTNIAKYLLPRHVKKTVQEDLNKLVTAIVFPEFDWSKVVYPEHILRQIELLDKKPLSDNAEFEIIRFLSQEYHKQLVEFTLAFTETALTQRIKDRAAFKLVYTPFEYLVKLNDDTELKEYDALIQSKLA